VELFQSKGQDHSHPSLTENTNWIGTEKIFIKSGFYIRIYIYILLISFAATISQNSPTISMNLWRICSTALFEYFNFLKQVEKENHKFQCNLCANNELTLLWWFDVFLDWGEVSGGFCISSSSIN
jgi:hypothetical protein